MTYCLPQLAFFRNADRHMSYAARCSLYLSVRLLPPRSVTDPLAKNTEYFDDIQKAINTADDVV